MRKTRLLYASHISLNETPFVLPVQTLIINNFEQNVTVVTESNPKVVYAKLCILVFFDHGTTR